MVRTKRLKLKPSARDKRRYFLVPGATEEVVETAILEYIGTLGLAQSAYMPVTHTAQEDFVGSVLRGSLDVVRAALALKGFEITKVSNTIKGLSRKS